MFEIFIVVCIMIMVIFMYMNFDINERLIKLANEAEEELKEVFKKYENTAMLSSSKILKAFQETRVSGIVETY